MEKNNLFQYNVEAYISTILENKKNEIVDINEFVIDLKYKSGSFGSFSVEKENLSKKIGEILSDENVSLISEINIGYLKDGIIINLNGINVY